MSTNASDGRPHRLDIQKIGAWLGVAVALLGAIAWINQLSGKVSALTPDSIKTEYETGIRKINHTIDHVPVVPVGGVIAWWGDRHRVPDGFELCDGKKTTTPGAQFTGMKPDLIDRFPKGAPESRAIVEELLRGGDHNLPAHFHGVKDLKMGGGDHNHTGGEHTHEVPLSDDDRGDDRRAGNAEYEDPRDSIILGGGGHSHAGGAHSHTLTGVVGVAEAKDGDGKDASGANQPAYTELFFIIRVR